MIEIETIDKAFPVCSFFIFFLLFFLVKQHVCGGLMVSGCCTLVRSLHQVTQRKIQGTIE